MILPYLVLVPTVLAVRVLLDGGREDVALAWASGVDDSEELPPEWMARGQMDESAFSER